MRASQASQPAARGRGSPAFPSSQLSASPPSQLEASQLASSASPPTFSSSIPALDRRYTFSYHSPPSPSSSPFVLSIRVEPSPPSFVLTVTDLRQLWQLIVTESVFDSARRASMYKTTSTPVLCGLFARAVANNAAAAPLLSHAVTASGTLTLTFSLTVGGVPMSFPFTLHPLLGKELGDGDEEKAGGGRGGRRRRLAEADGSLDFPDLDFLDAAASAHRPRSSTFDASLYHREMSLLVHGLLEAHLAALAAPPASMTGMQVTIAQLRAELEEAREETERMRAESDSRLRVSDNAAGKAGAGKRSAPVRKMADRSLINPNVKRRKQKGIKLGD